VFPCSSFEVVLNLAKVHPLPVEVHLHIVMLRGTLGLLFEQLGDICWSCVLPEPPLLKSGFVHFIPVRLILEPSLESNCRNRLRGGEAIVDFHVLFQLREGHGLVETADGASVYLPILP
jgi:hypothetical protein